MFARISIVLLCGLDAAVIGFVETFSWDCIARLYFVYLRYFYMAMVFGIGVEIRNRHRKCLRKKK